ncbi:hypothetical protein SNEBB_007719 [Seison nebaliae]|nr:hypothetical protein SNEBB_007719 [Seison nebaliae]
MSNKLKNNFSDFISRITRRKKRYDVNHYKFGITGLSDGPKCLSVRKRNSSKVKSRTTFQTFLDKESSINRSWSLTALESTSYMEPPSNINCSQSLVYIEIISPIKKKDACLVEDKNGKLKKIIVLGSKKNSKKNFNETNIF